MKRLGITLFAIVVLPALCAASTIIGKVLDAQGNPLPSAQLAIVGVELQLRFVVSTDEQGLFSQIVPAGKYTISMLESDSDVVLVRLESSEQRRLVLQADRQRLTAVSSEMSMALPDAPETDPSLAPIRDYQVQLLDTPASQALSVAELVNPFPAQKGGRFHGSVYEFHRNDNFDARNFFDPLGKPLPEYKRNQFGFSLAAGLSRNINVLGTFEGLRIIQGSTLLSHVPTSEMKRGNFGGVDVKLKDPSNGQLLPGNRIPEIRINPVARKMLALLPDPNRADPDRNFVNSKPVVRNRNTYSVRVDHQLKGGSNYFVNYWLSNGNELLVHAMPSLGSRRDERDQSLVVSHSQKITNRLLANMRFDFSRNMDSLGSVNSGRAGLLASIGIEGVSALDPSEEGYPDFRLSGYASFGDSGLPVLAILNRFDFEGGLSFTPGDHTFRVGVGLTSYQVNNNRSDGLRRGRFTFNGYYTGDAFADFLFGVPDAAIRGVGSDRADLRRKTWFLYARDEWKIDPRFSLSWGLTYNYFQPFRSVHNNVSGFYPLLFEPPLDGEIIIAGTNRARQVGMDKAGRRGIVFPDRNDFSPSFGLAFRPLGSNRLVFRSSYSIAYSPLGRDYYVSHLSRNFPFYYLQTALSPVEIASLDLSAPFQTVIPAEIGVRGIEPDLRTAYVQTWQTGMQSQVFKQWSGELWYSGLRGIHMPRTLAANVPLPGPGPVQPRRPNPQFGRFNFVTGSGAYSRHHLGANLVRRLGDGLSLRSGFDWQVSIGDVFWGNPSNPRNLNAERARSDYLPARQFYLSYIADLPFGKSGKFGREVNGFAQSLISGWRLSGITHIQDGYRFSIVSSGDPNNDGVADDRPNRLGAGVLDSSRQSIDGWFSTAAFGAPADYSFGNAGRNILTGPPFANWDVSVIKQTRFSDGNLIEFRIELFNAFNQVNFDSPNPVYGTSVFGKIFGARRAREIEVALRYSF